MTIYFSASPLGFYDDAVHSPSAIPGNAVALTPEAYAALLAGQTAGKRIAAGTDGTPMLVRPPPATPVVPATVTRFQARAALMQAGRLAEVEAAVAASTDDLVRLAWAESVEFPRSSPTIAALATAIGLTTAEIDGLFITAARITA